MTTTLRIPLLPLHAVLFPGGTLPLRIFEPRYLDMVSNCMKTETGFGICLIREGTETGKAADTFNTGTLSTISYFNQQNDGVLGITALGSQRFHIKDKTIQRNELTLAEVTLLDNEPPQTLPSHYQHLATLLQERLEQLGYPFSKLSKHYDDAAWVSCRLAELLPIRLEKKQALLQLEDCLERLAQLNQWAK